MLLARAFLADQRQSIISFVAESGFELGEVTVVQRKLFATEKPSRLFVQFAIEYMCPDLNAAREPAVLKVEGECGYNVDTKMFDQFVIGGLELQFQIDGKHTTKTHAFLAANFIIGHKSIENIVRIEVM